MKPVLIHNTKIVNEGQIVNGSIIIDGSYIKDIILSDLNQIKLGDYEVINANGLFLLPGIIDDQVHFREPGLTHKADIYSESKAAIAGGITSFMEMPNTIPQSTTIEILEKKYEIAAMKSLANYSFYLGATNNNIKEVKKINPEKICGLKVFMGSSTGNMLVDNEKTLNEIFAESPVLIATHCEDENTIKKNTSIYKNKYGDHIPIIYHPDIRSAEACFLSSSLAVKLARKHDARLHILHISTARELELFDNIPLSSDKKITSEVCIHHLWFEKKDYKKKGTYIKWNPAIKSAKDKNALKEAIKTNLVDIIATDHAPHTDSEKQNTYFTSPSGGPMVQHSLVAMLEMVSQNVISLPLLVNKMCHNPAVLFNINKRGFIRKGYFADLVLVDMNSPWKVKKENLYYKCKWSPMEDTIFKSKVISTIVNGKIVFNKGVFNETNKGMRLTFDR